MHSVKINRKELLKIIKDNKVKHVAEFNESVQDYINAVVKITKANLKLANTNSLEEIAKIRNLPQKPMSYEDNYTRAIRMLELSVDDTIEVEDHIFNQLVLDEWAWKQNFAASAALYKSI